MGIDQAAARVREIHQMAAAVRGEALPAPAPAAPDPAFALALQGALGAAAPSPGVAPGLPGAATPAAFSQLHAGSPALAVEAMLAMAPGAAAPVGGPSAPSRLSGDLHGVEPQLRAALEQVATRLGRDLDVVSGHRSRSEQEELYRRYLAGTGNLAAVPGTSRHESGRAADVYVDGVALANVPGAREAAAAAGLGFPVPGEAWHVEPVR